MAALSKPFPTAGFPFVFQDSPPPCPVEAVALGCADDRFNVVVPRRVELLFRE